MSKIRNKQLHQMALSFTTASFINSGHHLFNDGSTSSNKIDESVKLQTEQFFLLYSIALSRFKKLNDEQIKEEFCRLFEGFSYQ